MEGETYWRCERCGRVHRRPLSDECAGKCRATTVERVVVLPVAEYERLTREAVAAKSEGWHEAFDDIEDRVLHGYSPSDAMNILIASPRYQRKEEKP